MLHLLQNFDTQHPGIRQLRSLAFERLAGIDMLTEGYIPTPEAYFVHQVSGDRLISTNLGYPVIRIASSCTVLLRQCALD